MTLLTSREVVGLAELGWGVLSSGSRSLTVHERASERANANGKEARVSRLCPITIEVSLFSRILVLNPPLYQVIRGKKNGDGIIGTPSTGSICKERRNCVGPVTVRSYYNATGRSSRFAMGFVRDGSAGRHKSHSRRSSVFISSLRRITKRYNGDAFTADSIK